MRIRYLILLAVCLMTWNMGSAQSVSTLKEMADLQFKHAKYKSALGNYLKVQKEKPNNVEVKYKMGVCYLNMGQIQNGEQYLLFVSGQKGDESTLALYQLARLNHLGSKFIEAIAYYKRYLKSIGNNSQREQIKHYIRQCAAAREIKYQKELAIVDNMGDKVNGYMNDYSPIISPGRESTVYFSSQRAGNSGGLRDIEGLENDIIGQFNADIFSSQLVNGAWTSTLPINSLINSSRNDEVLGFSEDAKVMYYYKGYHQTKDGAIFTDTLSNTDTVIFPTEFKSPVDIRKGDETPQFFNDSIIIYASRKEGGYGGLDLYVIKRLPGGFWTRPKNLGDKINTAYDEKSPFLARDGRTLYYSSDQPKSLGGFDIFRAFFRDDLLDWTTPENMGIPINSPADDLHFSLSKNGLKSYLDSDRLGGLGGFDIYVGYFKAVQREQLSTSNPVAFNLVKQTSTIVNNNATPNPSTFPTEVLGEEKISLSPLFYTGDEILTIGNMNELNKIVRVASKYPSIQVELVGHTDDTYPEKFRLYFSYLRAAEAAEYLVKSGMKSSNILIKGLGDSYPVARNVSFEGEVSVAGKKLNRRTEIRLLNLDNTPITMQMKWPIINNRIKESKRGTYDKSLSGLSYKIQVAALRSMYDSDIIIKYSDAMLEKNSDESLMRYTVGLYDTYSRARQLKNDLQSKDGVKSAFVVPYIDGVRVDPVTAESLSLKYPDLSNFVKSW
ncbi:MAG: outer membrane protein OmpA-like peptidoglycan-associated protein [Maribacter sp.]|jgi:outer membrane protein OmpA-like peptidoglycan-associated protein